MEKVMGVLVLVIVSIIGFGFIAMLFTTLWRVIYG
jgi:hypothetical protein